mmetsp:Transcript_796/g.1677  ORF Transcript_796/g.1677 Transcript_796/m.1677 type:complete len:256 (+) Transcript_796:148-915(+)
MRKHTAHFLSSVASKDRPAFIDRLKVGRPAGRLVVVLVRSLCEAGPFFFSLLTAQVPHHLPEPLEPVEDGHALHDPEVGGERFGAFVAHEFPRARAVEAELARGDLQALGAPQVLELVPRGSSLDHVDESQLDGVLVVHAFARLAPPPLRHRLHRHRGVAAQVEVAVVVAALADHVRQHQAQAQVGEGGLGGKLSDPALRQKRAAEPLHLLRHRRVERQHSAHALHKLQTRVGQVLAEAPRAQRETLGHGFTSSF